MEAMRNDPYALGTFGVGLLLAAAAGIFLAVGIVRAREGSAVPAIAAAVLLALFTWCSHQSVTTKHTRATGEVLMAAVKGNCRNARVPAGPPRPEFP